MTDSYTCLSSVTVIFFIPFLMKVSGPPVIDSAQSMAATISRLSSMSISR